ncbi:MAG: hypothetical protein CL394_08665 [Acidiferrobacteraceae bacterium]|nr:hypothetical protein [Acidiferrobacteraceae bacterium]MDP7569077.1 hypothetical protein [Arenicellales bacterium]
MSYARINTVEYNSEADADAAAADYAEKAPGEFTEAQVLLSVRTGPTTGMAVSVYPDKAAFERSAPVREARLARMKDRVKSVQMQEGEVTLAHAR